MKRFTDAIRLAVVSENWFGALALSLALPDVCGRLENPTALSGARYAAWFEKWIEPKYTAHVGAQRTKHVFLSGGDCYALRCSYLHEGGANIEDQRARKALNDFHFITPPGRGMTVHCNQINNILQLQVDIFSRDMAEAVDAWGDSISNDRVIQDRISALLTVHDSSGGVRF